VSGFFQCNPGQSLKLPWRVWRRRAAWVLLFFLAVVIIMPFAGWADLSCWRVSAQQILMDRGFAGNAAWPRQTGLQADPCKNGTLDILYLSPPAPGH